MCGFAGIVELDGLSASALPPRLERALARLHPRGPDDRATWSDAHCALANTRLAVIDLSAAARLPMAAHGRVIAYNGEIYNFGALREELEAAGHRFATKSDTEVMLAGWAQWGKDLLPRLNGMFAFALWDPRTRALVLARDRSGKKPLLYHHEGSRLVFGSDLAALEAVHGTAFPLDPVALRQLFTLRYVPEPRSIVDGVRKLPPGHFLHLDETGATLERWHDRAPQRPEPYADPPAAGRDLVARFDEAVRLRMIADVPLGVFLSGGIDSALTAASMARQAGAVRSYTVGFEGAADYYEERPAAARVAQHLGTEHTTINVTPTDALDALDAVFEGLDEPFADSSALPTYLLSRETRRHVTVALSGDGADELFGGYRKYQGELLAGAYQAIPKVVRRGVIGPLAAALPESKAYPLLEGARRLRRFTAVADQDAVARQAGWARLLDEAELDALFATRIAAPALTTTIAALRDEAGETDPINAMLHADQKLGLTGDMLVKVDRMSMANSLEVRCPFLDHRVVACAEAMPGPWKLARGKGKKILREAFADRLPAEVFSLPKKGFEIPIAAWLTGPLADLVHRAIDPDRLARQGLFRPELPRLWHDQLSSGKRDSSEKLWTLIAFQAWCDRFRPDGVQ